MSMSYALNIFWKTSAELQVFMKCDDVGSLCKGQQGETVNIKLSEEPYRIPKPSSHSVSAQLKV